MHILPQHADNTGGCNQTLLKTLENNVFETALLFEGGSMRAAYSCSVAAHMLEQDLFFDNLYGVSTSGSKQIARVWPRLMDFLDRTEA